MSFHYKSGHLIELAPKSEGEERYCPRKEWLWRIWVRFLSLFGLLTGVEGHGIADRPSPPSKKVGV